MRSRLPDLSTQDDVRRVVFAFYRGIEDDPVLGPPFERFDWGRHLPRLVDVGAAAAFPAAQRPLRQSRSPIDLPDLDADHWLARFRATVDARYAGPAAERLKAAASRIADLVRRNPASTL